MEPREPEGFEPFETLPFVGKDYHGFEVYVGPLWHRREGDVFIFGFAPEPRHCNPLGRVHGGMLATLADHMLGGVAYQALGGRGCLTVSMTCHYLSSAGVGDWIEGRGQMTRQTGSLVFIQGMLTVGERPLLSASGIWRMLDMRTG